MYHFDGGLLSRKDYVHTIYILKKTVRMEHNLLFGLEEFLYMKFEW